MAGQRIIVTDEGGAMSVNWVKTRGAKVAGAVVALVLVGLLGGYWYSGREKATFAEAFANPAVFRVYEGLPFDTEKYADVVQKAVTLQAPQGPVYGEPLDIEPELAQTLTRLVDEGMRGGDFEDSMLRLACSFHTDYMLEAVSRSGARCLLIMCFTCGEIRTYVDGKQLSVCYPDLSEYKRLLCGYANQRPLALEWCDQLKDEIRRGSKFKLYKGTPGRKNNDVITQAATGGATAVIHGDEVYRDALVVDEGRTKSVKGVLSNGVSAMPQEGGEVLYPGCLFHADYVLEWNAAYGGKSHASTCLGCGIVHFYDRGAWKYMRLSGKAGEELRALLKDLKVDVNAAKGQK
jgi:hypothetical protein